MTVTSQDELEGLQAIGRIVANTMAAMRDAMEAGMTTRELDEIGRTLLVREGASPAPAATYGFPGATCISVNQAIAHGIPGDHVIHVGDLVNIDISASKDGYFADTGATYIVGRAAARLERLCRDGRQATQIGLAQVKPGRPLAGIGAAIGRFAQARGYSLIRNLASHGIGRALHEYPHEIPTWPTRGDARRITHGMVLTVEPFLSLGGRLAVEGNDGWTLYSDPNAPTVQYEHTCIATDRGPLIVTLPG